MIRCRLAAVLSSCLLMMLAVAALIDAQAPAAADLLIRNARVVDGAGSSWFTADVAVRGDTIVGSGGRSSSSHPRNRRVGARPRARFHRHSQSCRPGIFEVPTAENYVRQGVTTLIEGPDGSSPIPLGPFLAGRGATEVRSTSAASSARGRSAKRSSAMSTGPHRRRARFDARARRAGDEDGAFGLSSGLFYVPGAFAPTDEVVALARVAGRAAASTTPTCETRPRRSSTACARRSRSGAGRPADADDPSQDHREGQLGQERGYAAARGRGARARRRCHDRQYPYTASSTSIGGADAHWAQEGGREAG